MLMASPDGVGRCCSSEIVGLSNMATGRGGSGGVVCGNGWLVGVKFIGG